MNKPIQRKYFLILSAVLFLSCTPKDTGKDIPPPPPKPAEISPAALEKKPAPITTQNKTPVKEEPREPGPEDFLEHISLENCTITNEYSVQNIENIITDFHDRMEPSEMVEENDLGFYWYGFQVMLKKESFHPDEKYYLTARDNEHEFRIPLSLKEAIDPEDGETILGYYENINFENKFWFSEGSEWQIIVASDKEVLIDTYLERNLNRRSVFFYTLDNSPFTRDNLIGADLHRKYTFRSRKETELIIIYYSPDYDIYRPVFYLIPDKNDEQDYFDIHISWNNPILKGQYHFVPMKIDDLPTGEQTHLIFDSVHVQ